jgi:hypothetical protein
LRPDCGASVAVTFGAASRWPASVIEVPGCSSLRLSSTDDLAGIRETNSWRVTHSIRVPGPGGEPQVEREAACLLQRERVTRDLTRVLRGAALGVVAAERGAVFF